MTDAIDLSLLRHAAADDPQALAKLVQMSRNAIQMQTSQITTALDGGDFQTIYQAAHKMTGSAGIVGAQELSAICACIEAAGRNADAAGLARLQSQFTSAAARVNAALEAVG